MYESGESLNGATVYRYGASDLTPVVCVHGFGDRGDAFAALAEQLATDFHVVVPDLPGFGQSPPLEGHATIGTMATFVGRIVDHFAGQGPVGMLAHSIGAPIAVEAALARPRRVRAVFSIEGNLTEADAYFSGQATQHANAKAFKTSFIDGLRRMDAETKSLGRYIDAATDADAETMFTLGRDGAKKGQNDSFGQRYLALRSAGIKCFYYWGRHNTSLTTVAFIDKYADLGRLDHRTFEHHGHWVFRDAPKETADAARKFFSAKRRP